MGKYHLGLLLVGFPEVNYRNDNYVRGHGRSLGKVEMNVSKDARVMCNGHASCN